MSLKSFMFYTEKCVCVLSTLWNRDIFVWHYNKISQQDNQKFHYPYLPTRAGYDTRSIFKQSLTGLNSEFSFS